MRTSVKAWHCNSPILGNVSPFVRVFVVHFFGDNNVRVVAVFFYWKSIPRKWEKENGFLSLFTSAQAHLFFVIGYCSCFLHGSCLSFLWLSHCRMTHSVWWCWWDNKRIWDIRAPQCSREPCGRQDFETWEKLQRSCNCSRCFDFVYIRNKARKPFSHQRILPARLCPALMVFWESTWFETGPALFLYPLCVPLPFGNARIWPAPDLISRIFFCATDPATPLSCHPLHPGNAQRAGAMTWQRLQPRKSNLVILATTLRYKKNNNNKQINKIKICGFANCWGDPSASIGESFQRFLFLLSPFFFFFFFLFSSKECFDEAWQQR